MLDIIFKGLNWIFVVTGILGIIGIVFLLPGVIIGSVLISKEQDEIKKKEKIKKGIIFAVMPFILVVSSLLLIVILKSVQELFLK